MYDICPAKTQTKYVYKKCNFINLNPMNLNRIIQKRHDMTFEPWPVSPFPLHIIQPTTPRDASYTSSQVIPCTTPLLCG